MNNNTEDRYFFIRIIVSNIAKICFIVLVFLCFVFNLLPVNVYFLTIALINVVVLAVSNVIIKKEDIITRVSKIIYQIDMIIEIALYISTLILIVIVIVNKYS